MNSQALLTDRESMRRARQLQINPISNLTAQSLVRMLNNFDAGELREAALLFEAIADRDDVIPGVKSKREKSVSQMNCVVEVKGESTPAAEEHKRVLEDFWGNVEAVNSVDRDERGGFKMLVKQMMRSVSFRWAVHHIVWQPRLNGTLRATFQFMPLWLFENREGALRYRKDVYGYEGEVMPRDRWMVTRGDGLMYPCSIGYFFKRAAKNHLAIYSGKFSVPGMYGATSGGKDSEEGKSMRAAIAAMKSDSDAVLYNVKDPSKLPIHILEANGNPTAMPMPASIEDANRSFAQLYRGADLSTMSSKDGQGQGASLQGGEADILKGDDADTIQETLSFVSRMVIEWYFGRGVDPLAEVLLKDEEVEDNSGLLESATKLTELGARVSLSALASRLNVPLASADELALGDPKPNEVPVANARKVWKRFKKQTGTLKIPRADMPQIKGGDHAAFVNFLKARGIKAMPKMIQPGKLKLTQAEYAPEKVSRPGGGKKAILVSKDFYIIDGHHSWLRSQESGNMASILLLDAPVTRILALATAFPSSQMAANSKASGEKSTEFLDDAKEKINEAVLKDLAPVLEILERAWRAESESERDALLKSADEAFEKLKPGELAGVYEDTLASALVNGWALNEEENE